MSTKIQMFRGGRWSALLVGLLLAVRGDADEVKLQWMPSGLTDKLGDYALRRLDLSTNRPAAVNKLPSDLTAPLFGTLKFGPNEAPVTFTVVLDEPEGQAARLWIDANRNGDLTDDPPIDWKPTPGRTRQGAMVMVFLGTFSLKVPYGPETLELRFGLQHPATMPFLLYHSDYARTGQFTLSGKPYTVLLAELAATGDFRLRPNEESGTLLFIDVNGDGKYDLRAEQFAVSGPFNIGGTTYELKDLSASAGRLLLLKSSKTVEETKPLPNLAVGQKAVAFKAKTLEGKPVDFPQAYKGKLVLLTFWATWCGSCVAELPNQLTAYEKLHDKGLEILSVNLDQNLKPSALAEFVKGKSVTWPQIFDAALHPEEVSIKYNIGPIPALFLVDGDSGEILASGFDLYGPDLAERIEKALAKRKRS